MKKLDRKHFLSLIFLFFITLNLSRPSSTTMAITGGQDTAIQNAPYQLSLRIDGRHLCGAVLIAQNAALTVASCLVPNTTAINYTIVGGESDRTLHTDTTRVKKVNKIHTHPLYISKTYQNDIAYLEIEPMILDNERFQIIQMHRVPSSNRSSSSSSSVRGQNVHLTADTNFIVSGWGQRRWGEERLPTQLQSVNVTFVPNDQCQALYNESTHGPNQIFDSMLCAGNVQRGGGQDACRGDGGGPLVLPNLSDNVEDDLLIGLSSAGNRCGMANFPGIYTRISPYVKWIDCLLRRQNDEKGLPNNKLKKASRRPSRLAPPSVMKILHGEDTHINFLPYQLSLRFKGEHQCGAVLIAHTAALTAAHCFDDYNHENPDDFTIVGGEGDMSLHNDSKLIVKVTKIHVHDRYDSDKMIHDIAYLEIETMVLGDFVNVIQLNGQNSSNSDQTNGLTPGTNLTVSGWGKYGECDPLIIGYLQSARVPLVSNEHCQTLYNAKLKKPNKIMDSMLCAGHVGVEGSDSCGGDSGGPLVLPSYYVEDDLLVGLVSWGYGCGRSNFPGIYTRITSYLDWIEEMRLNSQKSLTSRIKVDKSKFSKLASLLRQFNSMLNRILAGITNE